MRKFPSVILSVMFATGLAAGLSACGGGGGGGGAATPPPVGGPPPPPPPSGVTYTPGKFDSSSNFKDQCQNPRAGTSDVSGTTRLENFWLRSWTNETYLWFDEVPDIDPGNGDDRLTYFDKQKTNATTASGKDKDDFHFSIDTEEYQQRVNSGASAGYGIEFALIATSPPRDIRVAYVDPGSPADNANIQRGAQILEVDGVDVRNGSDVDTLNNGTFPDTAGESHTFLIRDLDAASPRTVTLTSAIVTEQPVQTQKVIDTSNGKVGYIHYTTFGTTSAEEQIHEAIKDMKAAGVSDLVLDLRYNGGGFLDIAAELGYMIAGNARTNGRTFDRLTFNSKHTTTNPVTGQPLRPTPFHSTGQGFSISSGTALETLNLGRVYILSTGGTCSASEAIINALRGVDVEVVLIGTTTCGKPFGFYATDNCGETYFTIQFRGANDKGFGEYADGFVPANAPSAFGVQVPGCQVSDDFTNLLGDEDENLLEVALAYRETGTCPAGISKPSAQKVSFASTDDSLNLLNDPRVMKRNFLRTNRIENLPRGNDR